MNSTECNLCTAKNGKYYCTYHEKRRAGWTIPGSSSGFPCQAPGTKEVNQLKHKDK